MIQLKNKIVKFYRRHSLGITIALVCTLSGCFVISGLMQNPTIKNNRKVLAETKVKTEEERERQAEIDNLRENEVNTDAYIEKIASEKLGLVKSNATIFYDVSEDK